MAQTKSKLIELLSFRATVRRYITRFNIVQLIIETITFNYLPAVNTLTSGSDPYCIISLKKNNQLETVTKTECIKGVTSGEWKVNAKINFDRSDSIHFEVWVK